MNRSVVVLFSLVLFAGLGLRLWGINYGLPYLSHPDEARVVLDTLSMGHRLSLLPERPDYALSYRYLLLFAYGSYYLLGRLFNQFSGSLDFALKFFINHTNIYLISRIVSVIFGMLLAWPAYLIGRRIFKDEAIGIIAGIFVLFEFQLLQHSQWAIYPIILSFFVLFTFYFMFRLIEEPVRRNFILSGLFCGLSLSAQNQAIFLAPSLIVSYLLAFRRNKQLFGIGQFMRLASLSLACLAFFALLGNFYWFFIFKKSLMKTMELWGVTRVGFSSLAPYHYNIFSMFLWFMQELLRQDLFLGGLMALGFFYALLKRSYQGVVFIVFVVTYLSFTSQWGFRILHDMLSLLPVMCILAAYFLVKVGRSLFKGRYLYPIAIVVILPLAYQALIVDIKKMHKDTRVIAKEWIEENLPVGSKIGVDWSLFSVPLEGQIPFLLRNPIASKYYEFNLRPLLGNKYQEYLKSRKAYQIEELMLWSDEPLWPKDMPVEIIKEAGKKIVYRDLYSRFVFKDINTIINEDDYIIITSYAWGMFLLDRDPYKQNLFNSFIKDKPRLNYRHSESYIDDQRHGYIFYLIKQGRDFYTTLLYNRSSNIRLIKEFNPQNNLGPTIKIYKIGKDES